MFSNWPSDAPAGADVAAVEEPPHPPPTDPGAREPVDAALLLLLLLLPYGAGEPKDGADLKTTSRRGGHQPRERERVPSSPAVANPRVTPTADDRCEAHTNTPPYGAPTPAGDDPRLDA